jgi:hypothetical protein
MNGNEDTELLTAKNNFLFVFFAVNSVFCVSWLNRPSSLKYSAITRNLLY